MRLKLALAIWLTYCLLGSGVVWGQSSPDTLQLVDTTQIREARVPGTNPVDTALASKPAPKIDPWEFAQLPGFQVSATDSTLRWQMWPEWSTNLHRQNGVITYRRGGVGFNQGMLVDGHESRHQTLLWENHRLNDPVTGTARWAELPHHKLNRISVDSKGGTYESNFNINQYYVNKPLSRFFYDESKYDYRSLEFMVTRNISRQTNAELSYWLRRDGGEYERDIARGSQIYGRVYHHLDSDRFIKAAFLHNDFTLQESFGYQIPNMNRFNFDRFNTTPSEISAAHDWATNYLNLGYYRRKTEKGPDRYRLKLLLGTRKRAMSYSMDTTRYKIRSAETQLQAWENWRSLSFYGDLKASQYSDVSEVHPSLSTTSWNLFESNIAVDFTPHEYFNISVEPQVRMRSDKFSAYEMAGEISWDIGGWLLLRADGAVGTYMPTMQQLYWQSVEYQGNSQLDNEEISTVGGELKLHSSRFSLGAQGRIKQVEHGVFWDPVQDSSFVNTGSYYSTMATAFFNWTPPHFEFEGSATWQRFQSSSDETLVRSMTEGPARIQFKGSAYVKGYVFDRAAYVKAGVFGMMSPSAYRASRYHTPLDIWQSANFTAPIPTYHRVDLDLSARVRSIIVHLRYENITNEFTQRGYFETARYPMPGRRFMLGLRVVFNN